MKKEKQNFYYYSKGKYKPKEMTVKEELLFLTRGKCLMTFKEETEDDPITYHHLFEQRYGGYDETTFDNGVPLLKSSHDFLNIICEYDPKLYRHLNCSMDYLKEVMEMDYFFRFFYTEDEINEGLKNDSNYNEDVYEAQNKKFHLIDESINVEDLTLNQAVEARKALILYKEEVVPSIIRLKECYDRKEVYRKFSKSLAIKRKEALKKELLAKEYHKKKRRERCKGKAFK